MAKKSKRKGAPKTAAKSKARKKSAVRKIAGAKKRKTAVPRRKAGTSTFATTATFALTAGQKDAISAQVLKCIRGYVNDPQARYNTNLRTRYSWDDNNFIQLADDLPVCFSAAGMTIPAPISKPDLAGCDKIEEVCDVVIAAYE